MKHLLSLGLLLAVLWLAFSGYFDKPLLLGLGLASVVFAVLLSRRMDIIDRESHPLHMSFALVVYWGRLLWKIVLANLEVARLILHPRMPISPTLTSFESCQTTDLGKVILANSITLTPGTVTTDVEGCRFTVHSITAEGASQAVLKAMDASVPPDVEESA
jgi:multicomponent Na+:H+ antiporter subunit E